MKISRWWFYVEDFDGHGATIDVLGEPDVWLGVTVENQEATDERIPLLLKTPAAMHWISAEPLIGSVPFRWASWVNEKDMHVRYGGHHQLDGLRGIDLVVVGGESGTHARPMHPDWAHALRDQYIAAGIPIIFKQHREFYGLQKIDKFIGIEATDEQINADKSAGWVSLDGAYHDGNSQLHFGKVIHMCFVVECAYQTSLKEAVRMHRIL